LKTCWRSRGGVASIGLLGMALLIAAFLAPGAQAYSQSYQSLMESPVPMTSVAADPTTGIIYAQEFEGEAFFKYDPHTNAWTELAKAPIESENDGGAAYLGGKIYVVYPENNAQMGVYDIALNSWTEIPNPLGEETGDITSGNGKLYLVGELKFASYDPATGLATPLGESPVFQQGRCKNGFEKWGGLQFDGSVIYGHQGNDCNGFALYTIGSNSWTELPALPYVQHEEGGVLGSALNPVTNTYLTYGSYGGETLFRYDIEGGAWTISTVPFAPKSLDDGGMAYVSQPGIEGVYMVQGERGDEFFRYNEKNVTDLAPSMTTSVVPTKTGGEVTYSVAVKNNGPERAGGVNLADTLPAGTSLLSIVPSQGTCTGTTCALGILKSGASAAVTVKVNAPGGFFTNTAAVSSQATDTNPANDGAVSSAAVRPPCKLPKLAGKKVKDARKALKAAHCVPGKVKHVFSGKVKKGRVVKGGKPGKAFISGTKVKLVVSKGEKPKKAHHKK
jgi:uncharacterized repeat protein (TIGR01451 family)